MSFTNLNKKLKLSKNKKLFYLVFSCAFIFFITVGGISTSFNVLHASYSKKLRNENKKFIQNNIALNNNVKLRVNPINNFSYLNIKTENNCKGKKLVLTTIDLDNGKKTYGVALVDALYNIVSTWSLNNVNKTDTTLNYTTNIIPGADDHTFFVLAGICNLAKALNYVYSYYRPNSMWFDEIVRTTLFNAPSIKIFKIHVNNDQITSDVDHPFYDFKYPEFESSIHSKYQNGGLLFFNKLGVFSSSKIQETGENGDDLYYGEGYYQYLFYGQQFQYNYSSVDDEFALISSPLGVDLQMGNLYAYYDTSLKSTISALETDNFYNNVLTKVFTKDSTSLYAYNFKSPYNSSSYLTYKIQQLNGSIIDAPEEDQLTSVAAISIAFMMDFAPSQPIKSETWDYTSSRAHQQSKFIMHDKYLFAPGWFIFRPHDDYISYYVYSSNDDNFKNLIWYQIASTKYVKSLASYYSFLVGPGLLYSETACSYFYVKFNYFEDINVVNKYESHLIEFSVKISNNNSYSLFIHPVIATIFENQELVVCLDLNNKKIGISLNSNFYWIDISLKFKTLLNDSSVTLKYDKKSQIISLITNNQIFSIPLTFNENYSNLYINQQVIVKNFINKISNNSYVDSEPLLDASQKYKFQKDDGTLEGVIYYIYDANTKKYLAYVSESNISSSSTKILDIISYDEVGYQPLKNDNDFTVSDKNKSISSLLILNPKSLGKLFFFGNRVSGTSNFGNRVSGTSKNVKSLGCVITKSTNNTICISELISYKNNVLIGFSPKQDQITSLQKHKFVASEYSNLFNHQYDESIVWYIEPSEIKTNPALSQVTISDLVNEYNSNYSKFQKKYFNLFVKKIDSKFSDLVYALNIESYDIKKNTIVFSVVVVNKSSSVIVATGNEGPYKGKQNFCYNNVFSLKSSKEQTLPDKVAISKTETLSIVSICIGVILFILLCLGIGYAFYRHNKNVKHEILQTRKKINKLTLAVGNVFEKLNKNIEAMREVNKKLLSQKSLNKNKVSLTSNSLTTNKQTYENNNINSNDSTIKRNIHKTNINDVGNNSATSKKIIFENKDKLFDKQQK